MKQGRTGWLPGVALVLALRLGTPGPAEAQGRFSDVPETHWAYAAVNELAERGILRGYPPSPAGRPARQPAATSPRSPRQTSPGAVRGERSGQRRPAPRRPGRR